MNKAMGMSKGFPDYLIFLPNPRSKFGDVIPIAIEMKRADKRAKVTAEQTEWLNILGGAGFKTAVCYGCDQAIDFLIKCGYKEPRFIEF